MKTEYRRQLALLASIMAATMLAGCGTFAPTPTPWIITVTATPQHVESTEEVESEASADLPATLAGTDGGCEHILWPLAEGRRWQFQEVNTGESITLITQQLTDGSFSLNLNGQEASIGCIDGMLTGLPPAYLTTHPELHSALVAENAQGALMLDSGQLLPYATAAASWDYQADISGALEIDGINVTVQEGRFVTVFRQQGVTPVTLASGEILGVVITFQTFMEINAYSGIQLSGPLLIQTSGQIVFTEGTGPVQIDYFEGTITSTTGNYQLPGGTTFRLVTVSR